MTAFKGNLGNYKIILTEDNTETVYSEYFDEACHNLSGAYEETLHNYILGCEIPDQLTKRSEVTVLDVGFGVGVGLLALLNLLKNPQFLTSKLTYYSIELDETLLLWALNKSLPELKCEKKSMGSEKNFLQYYHGLWEERLEIMIFVGDGRQTLPQAESLGLLKPLDAIFQDAFSPKKNPALWSVEWFQFLAAVADPTVILSTYSSSISIRKSLVSAGWTIQNARGFAMKRSMTKAVLTGETSAELLLQLERSPSLEIKDK